MLEEAFDAFTARAARLSRLDAGEISPAASPI